VKYRYNGRTMDHLPENPLISGMRNIVLSFEAKATKGSHVLALSLKYGPAGGYETRNYVRINENRYAQHEVVLRARPDYKASLYIDNQDVTDPGSSVQIKDLKLYEVQPSDER
jgi:hypothetical protein